MWRNLFYPTILFPNFLIWTYFNHPIFCYNLIFASIPIPCVHLIFYSSKLGTGNEIKIAILKVNLHNELKHAKVVTLMLVNNLLHKWKQTTSDPLLSKKGDVWQVS
jgi:hypothetical protein